MKVVSLVGARPQLVPCVLPPCLWGHESMDLLYDVPVEAAPDLAARPALREASPHVVLGTALPAQTAEGDWEEGSVCLAVTASVGPAALGLAGGSLDWVGAA